MAANDGSLRGMRGRSPTTEQEEDGEQLEHSKSGAFTKNFYH